MNDAIHPFLTNGAMLTCAHKTRNVICDAGDMLLSLHARATRRFHGELSEEAKQAIAELDVLANHMLAVLARFDRAEANLGDALSRDS